MVMEGQVSDITMFLKGMQAWIGQQHDEGMQAWIDQQHDDVKKTLEELMRSLRAV